MDKKKKEEENEKTSIEDNTEKQQETDTQQEEKLEEQETDKKERIKKSRNAIGKEILEWIYCVIIAVVLAVLFRYFIGTPTIVKMESMFPTLEQNQRLWLNRIGRTTKTLPKRGQIITFEEPSKVRYNNNEGIDKNKPIAQYINRKGIDWFTFNFLEIGKKSYIKRVIALPGEQVQIKDGKVFVDGEQLQEDYLQDGIVTDTPETGFNNFTVPDNCVFAMGDNRNHSQDCRDFGCIPLERIESTVALRIWPLNLFGKVE